MTIELDKISGLVACPASIKWAELEQQLNNSGYTLGFCNPHYQRETVGDLLNKNRKNLFYQYYGHPVNWCISLKVHGKDGRVYSTKTVPRTAVGPDFRRLLLGMGNSYGRLEEITLRIHRIPEAVDWICSYWTTAADAKNLIKELTAIHIRPSFAGVYEPDQQPERLKQDHMTMLAIRFVGTTDMVHCYYECALERIRKMGGRSVRVSRHKIMQLLERLIKEGP